MSKATRGIVVALTKKEASALRRSAAVPVGAASPEHVRQHVKAVQKIKDAENGWGQAAIQGSDDG
jgi:hypothetical protein